MKLSVIIVNYNTAEQTKECVLGLQKFGLSAKDQEIIVVDNDSKDNSVQLLKQVRGVQVVKSGGNLGFAKGCNIGAQLAKGAYLGFINSDCEIRSDAIKKLVDYLEENGDTSAIVPRLLESDGAIQHNVAHLPTFSSILRESILGKPAWYRLDALNAPTDVEAFSGAALIIRKKDYWVCGGFDERYFMYVEDVELSYQLNKRHKTITYLPSAVFTHHSGGSSHNDRPKLNQMLFNNRIDFVKRHLPTGQAILAISSMYAGIVIMLGKSWIKTLLQPSSWQKTKQK